MSEIVLTDEQYKSLPYAHTTIPRSKTYGEIIGLLEAHHIPDYQFTKVQGREVLSFPIRVKRRDVEQGFVVKMTVPKLLYPVSKGRYGPKTMTYLENVSWRVFWWHIKSKLEAIEYGISDELREFMYNITYSLTDQEGQKKEVTLGEEVLDNLEQLPKLSPIARNERMLEHKEVQ